MRLADHSWNSPHNFGEWAELLFFLMKCSVEESLPEAANATTTFQCEQTDLGDLFNETTSFSVFFEQGNTSSTSYDDDGCLG